MTFAAFRTSSKEYTDRPPAANASARAAWDVLSQNGTRKIVSMGLLDGLWICVLPDGLMDEVDAGWIKNLTPKALRKMSAAIDRRAEQGRA